MKTAGDILSGLFDERFLKKAQGYSKFFDSWVDITAKNGIAAASDHSRIKDLDRGIILIETDHPGWKQLIQTKQSKLLNDFRRRFPELDISGISLMLGKPDKTHSTPELVAKLPAEEDLAAVNPSLAHPIDNGTISTHAAQLPTEKPVTVPSAAGLDAIKDEEFKETLKKLGQTIAGRSRK